MFRRLLLIVLFVAIPPLMAWGVYEATLTYLAVSHKFMDPKMLTYSFFGELALFYVAGLMELRSRWSRSG